MARAKKKKLKPDWFNLKKYDKARKLNAEGWLYQLTLRRECLNEVVNNSDSLSDQIQEYLGSIYKEGIVGYSDEEIHELYNADLWNHSDPENALSTLSVFSLETGMVNLSAELSDYDQRMMCILENEAKYSQEEVNEANEWFLTPYDLYIRKGLTDDVQEDDDEEINSFDIMYHAFNFNTRAHAVVNLAATDKQIISDFKCWLEQCREQLCDGYVKKAITEKDLRTWAAYGVLPYLDLYIWMLLEDVKLTYNELGKLILGHLQIDTTESIRKTTLSHVVDAISMPVILALREQARADRMKKRKK